MARIRIVEQWLRSPASPPSHWRSIMVVAEQWAEQRVLMRAYAESVDQTRPTIVLHGVELAIGPAGTDPHDAWGIHVHPQEDGRAQEIAEALRLAAKRLAGSKGSPPRLEDEASAFERKRTDNWAPGTPRGVPGSAADSGHYYEPLVASYVAPQSATYIGASGMPAAPQVVAHAPVNQQRMTPVPMAAHDPGQDAGSTRVGRRRRGWTSPLPATPGAEPGRTALGYESGAGAQSAIIRLGLRPSAASQLGRIGSRTVPADFEISRDERQVLNALAEVDHLAARTIAQMIGVADAVQWMEALIGKLNAHGLDIVVPGAAIGGEPTYRLNR